MLLSDIHRVCWMSNHAMLLLLESRMKNTDSENGRNMGALHTDAVAKKALQIMKHDQKIRAIREVCVSFCICILEMLTPNLLH